MSYIQNMSGRSVIVSSQLSFFSRTHKWRPVIIQVAENTEYSQMGTVKNLLKSQVHPKIFYELIKKYSPETNHDKPDFFSFEGIPD